MPGLALERALGGFAGATGRMAETALGTQMERAEEERKRGMRKPYLDAVGTAMRLFLAGDFGPQYAQAVQFIASSDEPSAPQTAKMFTDGQSGKEEAGLRRRTLTAEAGVAETTAQEYQSPGGKKAREIAQETGTAELQGKAKERQRRTGIESQIDTLLGKSNWTLADATKFDALSASIGRQANLSPYFADQLRTTAGLTKQDRLFNALSAQLRVMTGQRIKVAQDSAIDEDAAKVAVDTLVADMMMELRKIAIEVYGSTPEGDTAKITTGWVPERPATLGGATLESLTQGANPFAGAGRSVAPPTIGAGRGGVTTAPTAGMGAAITPNPATVQQVVAFLRDKPDWKRRLDIAREAAEAKRDEQAWAEADEVEAILSGRINQ